MLLAILAFWWLATLPGLTRLAIARLGKMAIHRVSLGVGAVLARRGALRLHAIPIGLFVHVGGLVPGERPFSPEDPRAFAQRPWPFQLLIHISSIISYYIIAAAIAAACTLVYGKPVDGTQPIVGGVKEGMPAEAAGLQAGDEIVSIGGLSIGATTEVAPAVSATQGRPTEVVVLRDGERRTHVVTAIRDGEHYRIGIELWSKEARAEVAPGEALVEGAQFPVNYTRYYIDSIARVFTGTMRAEFSGPVGIVKQLKRERPTFERSLRMLAVVSTTLAITFVLPIPGLDGGRLLAWIFRRRRKATGEARDLGTVEIARPRMPTSVGATLAFWLLVTFAWVFAGVKMSVHPIVVGEVLLAVAIVSGILRRHPAAWRLGRTLPFLLVPAALFEFGAEGGLFLIIGILGLLPSTARWFGMVCPACGSRECGASASDAYGCVACGSVWKARRA